MCLNPHCTDPHCPGCEISAIKAPPIAERRVAIFRRALEWLGFRSATPPPRPDRAVHLIREWGGDDRPLCGVRSSEAHDRTVHLDFVTCEACRVIGDDLCPVADRETQGAYYCTRGRGHSGPCAAKPRRLPAI